MSGHPRVALRPDHMTGLKTELQPEARPLCGPKLLKTRGKASRTERMGAATPDESWQHRAFREPWETGRGEPADTGPRPGAWWGRGSGKWWK